MEHFVYILFSENLNTYYKGYSTDVFKRLQQHNAGMSNYTRKGIPWKLVYYEKCLDKKSALIRERKLKHANRNYIRWLIQSDKNLLNKI